MKANEIGAEFFFKNFWVDDHKVITSHAISIA